MTEENKPEDPKPREIIIIDVKAPDGNVSAISFDLNSFASIIQKLIDLEPNILSVLTKMDIFVDNPILTAAVNMLPILVPLLKEIEAILQAANNLTT